MKQKLFLISLLFLAVGCAGRLATTTFTVKKPVTVQKTYRTARGDSTVVVNELVPVFSLETREQTPLGRSRTTVPEMALSYRVTQEGEVLGSVAGAFREKGDRVIDYVKQAPLPGNPRDWRQIISYRGYPVYGNGAGSYYYRGGYVSDFMRGAMGLPSIN